jgi:hypothetical protein
MSLMDERIVLKPLQAEQPYRYPNEWLLDLRTQTRDLYRVNFDVNNLKPFSCLAFPFSHLPKTALKRPIFGDELVTSFVQIKLSKPRFLQTGFWHRPERNRHPI